MAQTLILKTWVDSGAFSDPFILLTLDGADCEHLLTLIATVARLKTFDDFRNLTAMHLWDFQPVWLSYDATVARLEKEDLALGARGEGQRGDTFHVLYEQILDDEMMAVDWRDAPLQGYVNLEEDGEAVECIQLVVKDNGVHWTCLLKHTTEPVRVHSATLTRSYLQALHAHLTGEA